MVANLGVLFDPEYHLKEVTHDAAEYYLRQGEAPGRWAGSGARLLGLQGEVGPKELRALFAGRDPATGERLVSARGSAARARASSSARSSKPAPDSPLTMAEAAEAIGVSESYLHRLAVSSPPPTTTAKGAWILVSEDARGSRVVDPAEVARFIADRKPPRAVPAYDMALRAPKSVSILHALGHLLPEETSARLGLGPGESVPAVVLACHQAAVGEAVRLLERQAAWIRGPSGRV